MDTMQDQIGSILNDPQMMQQIMAMAQNLSAPQPPTPPPPPEPNTPAFDPSVLQQIAGIAGQSRLDKNQQALLKALTPYLSRERISKLERAMRAARTAKLASGFLGAGGLHF